MDVSTYIDTLKQFDSLSIAMTIRKNNILTKLLTKAIILFRNDPQFKNQNDVINLMAQLEGAENRITVARYEYNVSCKIFNRPDLRFQDNEDTKAVRVEF
jgi:hypothetical protein